MQISLPTSLIARNPRFRHFLLASTTSLIGSNAFDIALPLYVLKKTGSVIDLSLVSTTLLLPYFLMAPLTGYFSDTSRKRLSLLLADLGQVFLLGALSAYVWSGAEPLWPLLALIFCIKTLMLTFETISQFQLIPALAGEKDLTSANTWFLSFHRVIQIAGPLLGGALVHYFGVQSCIWVNILSFAATLHFTWRFGNLDTFLTEGSHPAHTPLSAHAVLVQFRESLRFIWASPVFHPFILLMFLFNLSSLTLNSPTLTYYFTVTHAFSSAEYGLITSGFGLVGIVGFLLSPVFYRKHAFPLVFQNSSLFQAAFSSLCVAASGFPLFMGALLGISRAGSSVLSMGTYIIRQTRIPRAQSGAINSSLRMFFMSAAPLSSLLQGWVILHFGIYAALIGGAVCFWGTWWYTKALARAYHDQSADPISLRKSA